MFLWLGRARINREAYDCRRFFCATDYHLLNDATRLWTKHKFAFERVTWDGNWYPTLKLIPTRTRYCKTSGFLHATEQWLIAEVHLGPLWCWLSSTRCCHSCGTCCTTPVHPSDRTPCLFSYEFKRAQIEYKNCRRKFRTFFFTFRLIRDSCDLFLS